MFEKKKICARDLASHVILFSAFISHDAYLCHAAFEKRIKCALLDKYKRPLCEAASSYLLIIYYDLFFYFVHVPEC